MLCKITLEKSSKKQLFKQIRVNNRTANNCYQLSASFMFHCFSVHWFGCVIKFHFNFAEVYSFV